MPNFGPRGGGGGGCPQGLAKYILLYLNVLTLPQLDFKNVFGSKNIF